MARLGHRQRAILARLNQGEWVKGRELAADVGVLGHLLWHYIERLRDRGYEIEADQRRGYRIAQGV